MKSTFWRRPRLPGQLAVPHHRSPGSRRQKPPEFEQRLFPEDNEGENLNRAYVRLHVLRDIEKDKVPEIAEGLNRSKQVDDPSLENLRGHFETIKKVVKGLPGAEQIAYHMGDEGSVYITEVLVYVEMFNCERYDARSIPTMFSVERKLPCSSSSLILKRSRLL